MPSPAPTAVVYKICTAHEWRAAVAQGRYTGSADDLRDGFIHLSTGAQLAGTAAKHFAGKQDLVLAAFSLAALSDSVRWEPSRGGALFPHAYAALDPNAALWVRPMPLDPDGVPQIPEDVEQ